MTSPTDPDMNSPLGSAAEVERVRSLNGSIGAVIDDLERVVTPEFHRADQKAISSQRMIKRTRLSEMCGGALVATLAIIGLAREEWQWGAMAGLIAGLTAVVSAQRRASQLEHWLDQRRVAEELRSLYFRVLTAAATIIDSADRRRWLGKQVDAVVAPEWILAASDAANAPLDRGTPVDPTAWKVYRVQRLEAQINWMKGKSRTVTSRSKLFGHIQTALLAAAAIAGLIIGLVESASTDVSQSGASTNDLTTWLGVIVAASAGLVSLAAAADTVVASERLAEHYDRTVHRLESIERSLDDDAGWTADIDHTEAVLLAEHRVWQRITQGNNQ